MMKVQNLSVAMRGLLLALPLALSACAQAPVATKSEAKAADADTVISLQDRQAFFVNDVRRGECADIEKQLKSGLSIDGFDGLDQTPLIAAIGQSKTDCVTKLIQLGANVNLPDHAGWTPLIHAAYFGSDLGILQQLIDHGADVNGRNDRGITALYLASAAGHEPQVQALIAHGADAGIASNAGYTPLQVAQLRGLTRVAALLTGKAPPATDAPPSIHSN